MRHSRNSPFLSNENLTKLVPPPHSTNSCERNTSRAARAFPITVSGFSAAAGVLMLLDRLPWLVIAKINSMRATVQAMLKLLAAKLFI